MKTKLSLLLSLCLLLTGCSLAQAQAQPDPRDRVVGVLFTEEAPEEGQVLEPEQGRVPHFLQGPCFLAYEQEDDVSRFWTHMAGTAVEPSNFRVNSDGAGVTSLHAEGTLLVDAEADQKSYYLSPIYLRSDGSVYALGHEGDSMTAGEMPRSYESDTGSVLASIRAVTLPDSYRLWQMDAENRPMDSQDYAPSDVPSELSLGRDCSYVMLEALTGDTVTERQICGPDDQENTPLTFYRPWQDGLCEKALLTLNWEVQP